MCVSLADVQIVRAAYSVWPPNGPRHETVPSVQPGDLHTVDDNSGFPGRTGKTPLPLAASCGGNQGPF